MVESIPRTENTRKKGMYSIHFVLILRIHGLCLFKPQKSSVASHWLQNKVQIPWDAIQNC